MSDSAYDRWRPALASVAILATVVAIAVLRRDDAGDPAEIGRAHV